MSKLTLHMWLLILCMGLIRGPVVSVGQDKPTFSQNIRPILVRKCFACHGPDEESREGGLALHQRETALAELDSGETGIVPGDADSSEIFRRIASTDAWERMPPKDASDPLTEEEQQLIRNWINSGAEYDQHWSFKTIRRPATPTVDSDWPTSPIDRFVIRKLRQTQLSPAEPASKATLLRRLALDLTGIPPHPDQVKAFLADETPAAYEKQVDRLLASPRFGEHWARQWLDLARYADSQGYAQDEIRTIWPYRDWVIKAINDDMPYDQFTIEQLAGDLLENSTSDQLVATGFHRNTMTNTEGGTNDEEFRHAAVVDRVNTTGQVWMGLTLGCAQCHTHKYDPITHEEYYRVFAVFNQTADNDHPDNRPNIPYLSDTNRQQLKKLGDELIELNEMNIDDPAQLGEFTKRVESLKSRMAAIRSFPTPVMQELAADKQRLTQIAIRGAFADKGEAVEPGVPLALANSDSIPTTRLELANWLMADSNPLTARVAANRIWQQFFGAGLVITSEDFGSQGDLPSHPQLLDWLAAELRSNGWSRKKLCKTIVMSATYRQSTQTESAKLELDPDNRLLSRGARYRLSAEQLRDYALSVSGLLSEKMYGPPVKPPQPKSGLNAAFGGSLDWETSPGEDRYRRGIYTLWRRTNPYPSFMALDAVDRRVCSVRRIETNSPVSAFITLNDPAFFEAAVATGMNLLKSDAEQRIELAYWTIVGRAPRENEQAAVENLLQATRKQYQADNPAAQQLVAVHAPARNIAADQLIELAAWSVVCNTLLNLDEVLTRN